MEENKQKSKNIVNLLQLVAPGTPLRDGINNVLRAETGGLIVLGYNELVKEMVDGGFFIQCPYSPASLYELAKMDGAIVLNETGSKIILANAQLIPDASISSIETGMRHRTAERVAKQTGNLVIAISQRRNVITLYQGNVRYTLRDIGVILTKANQAIQTLEKYKVVWNQRITTLGLLEFEEVTTLAEVVSVLHSVEMVLRIKNEVHNYVNELGTEGRLIRLQLAELVSDIEKEALLLIKDYHYDKEQDPHVILRKLQELSNMELLDDVVIVKLLGYPPHMNMEGLIVPRGYRILTKISRLPPLVIENLIETFRHLKGVCRATMSDLDEVEGIGEVRARKIKDGLKRIQEHLHINRHH
ncbi:DNA integrity scanning diadenylate cyclase DisA [Priestia taiwanensis]|uniref:DNA integrity scanning protein DisA n=1 Tax=Priestia taiwanensis TaxID=1347902 RepID=A0A917ERU0_9BACI|nr:DNA integrity scanning diadenylate cyclase DisA [Priestia taiwanensis]MBM7365144.1 diadenylate cyclase [Priestia taiwanensis]GGE83933.1 DNA integrity scanning protein DisA [Priestia taiwanensis]